MPAVLVCAREIVVRELEGSPVWRDGLERFVANGYDEALTMAAASHPLLVVVDRDLARAEALVQQLRKDAATQHASIVVVAGDEMDPTELSLLSSGANAVLRLPPGAEWDERLQRLLNVPTRKQTRVPVTLGFEATFGTEHVAGQILNMSLTGMLVECSAALAVGDSLAFSFHLHGFETSSGDVSGEGRVVRLAGANRYGVEFTSFADVGQELLRRFLLAP